jgi:pyruvate dehydrogenase E1 component alpha subunit
MDNKDPIQLLGQEMAKAGIATEDQLLEIQQQVEKEVVAAVESAREAPYPAPDQAFEDLYS